jgi:hypothetical protein
MTAGAVGFPGVACDLRFSPPGACWRVAGALRLVAALAGLARPALGESGGPLVPADVPPRMERRA